MNGAAHESAHALMAKGIYLHETEKYVLARDFLNRGLIRSILQYFTIFYKTKSNRILFLANNILNTDVMCLQFLANTHLKLHAFTLAEYCYTKINLVNVNYLRSLVEQGSQGKSQGALAIAPQIESDSKLSDDERAQLTEMIIK